MAKYTSKNGTKIYFTGDAANLYKNSEAEDAWIEAKSKTYFDVKAGNLLNASDKSGFNINNTKLYEASFDAIYIAKNSNIHNTVRYRWNGETEWTNVPAASPATLRYNDTKGLNVYCIPTHTTLFESIYPSDTKAFSYNERLKGGRDVIIDVDGFIRIKNHTISDISCLLDKASQGKNILQYKYTIKNSSQEKTKIEVKVYGYNNSDPNTKYWYTIDSFETVAGTEYSRQIQQSNFYPVFEYENDGVTLKSNMVITISDENKYVTTAFEQTIEWIDIGENELLEFNTNEQKNGVFKTIGLTDSKLYYLYAVPKKILVQKGLVFETATSTWRHEFITDSTVSDPTTATSYLVNSYSPFEDCEERVKLKVEKNSDNYYEIKYLATATYDEGGEYAYYECAISKINTKVRF